ncbi:MAG TPA: hypothetical protein VFZ65_16220 [Planctomycetota bacterium]|nr:hypothetical protein [Planctomycetota bacterium]
MRSLSTVVALLPAALLPAQITNIAAMTQPSSVIDMDAVGPAGPTTLAALITAGTNGGAPLAGITLIPNTAAAGVYNTNPQLGLALGYDQTNNQLILVAPPAGVFDAFDAQIDLALPSTEFGIAIGDWASTMILEFRLQGTVVGTITSPSYSAPNAKFFQSMVPFDEVFVRASSTVGNWVIPELHIQNGYGTPATNSSIGAGCGGLGLTANTRPVLGTSWDLVLGGVPATGTVGVEIYGLSDPGINDLAAIGMSGCGLRAALDYLRVFVVGGPSHAYSLLLPNTPTLVGTNLFATDAVFQDPPVNPFGAISANAIVGMLGDI